MQAAMQIQARIKPDPDPDPEPMTAQHGPSVAFFACTLCKGGHKVIPLERMFAGPGTQPVDCKGE